MAARLDQIKSQAKISTSDYDRNHHEKRVAALTGKVAVIKVGGATETEIEEKKFRVDDAVAAVKAALEEGVVIGGGISLINLAAKIKRDASEPSIAAGADVLKAALIQPFRILLDNAGLNPDEWLPRLKGAGANMGVDVSNPGDPDKAGNGLVDLKTTGIIDPSRVTREAIQNAVSIGGTAITMGALVVDIPEKDSGMGAGMGAEGGMGGF